MMKNVGIISSSRKWRYQPEIYPFMEATGIPNNSTPFNEGTAHEKSGIQFWNDTDILLRSWKIGLGLDLGYNNLKKRLKLVYPTIGGTATRHKYNLADPAVQELIFFGGWTHDGSGALPNGTNAYLTTTEGLFPTFTYGMESASFGFDSKTNDDGFSLDLYTSDGARADILLRGKYSGNATSYFDNENNPASAAIANSQGLYLLNRIDVNNYELHKEDVLVLSAARTAGHEISSRVLQRGLSGSQFPTRKHTLMFGASKFVLYSFGGFTPTERGLFTSAWRTYDNSNFR